jgi:hypothetical protein
MQSEFKLLKQLKNSGGHYARVTVDVEPTRSGIYISEAFGETLDEGYGEVNRKIAPRWIDAALAGAKHCAEILVSQGRLTGCRVKVQRVFGLVVDTREEDLFCAGALATWQALNPNQVLPPFYFAENKWHIQF